MFALRAFSFLNIEEITPFVYSFETVTLGKFVFRSATSSMSKDRPVFNNSLSTLPGPGDYPLFMDLKLYNRIISHIQSIIWQVCIVQLVSDKFLNLF